MKLYDPDVAPDPKAWLAIDEKKRIELAEAHHRSTRIKLPNVKTHAVFHAIVENQIAEALDPVVRAMARLMKEGLSRHDAVHAIGSVVAEQVFDAIKTKDTEFSNTAQAHYDAAIERLSAKEWLRQYGAK